MRGHVQTTHLPARPQLSISSIPRNPVMTALEPWAVSDPIPNPESNSATTATLDSYIKNLTAAKITVEIPAVKATFESAIVILTLIRVRILALLPFS